MTTEGDRYGLRGLNAVAINFEGVKGLSLDAEKLANFKREGFFFIESALTTAGISVLPTYEEIVLSSDRAWLGCKITIVNSDEQSDYICVMVSTMLLQPARLDRSNAAVNAVTWSKVNAAVVKKELLYSTMQEAWENQIGWFIKDYKEAQQEAQE